jgi:hypothetical protein
MRVQWRLLLPIVGLLLFSEVTGKSLRMNRETPDAGTFCWSWWRLDSDVLQRSSSNPSKLGTNSFVGPMDVLIGPRMSTESARASCFSRIPARRINRQSSRHAGVSEVITFMASMPGLMIAWHWVVGRLVDRWRNRVKTPATSA